MPTYDANIMMQMHTSILFIFFMLTNWSWCISPIDSTTYLSFTFPFPISVGGLSLVK